MDSMIHINPKIEKDAPRNLADSICNVLDSIRKNNLDRETSIKALDIMSEAFSSNVSVNNCNLTGRIEND